MNDRVIQFRVGVVVLATVIITALLVTLNSSVSLPWGPGKYEVRIDLERAPGVQTNTPVHKNGILIGRVESVEDQDDRVVVVAKIDSERTLYPQYDCQVRTTVLGDSTIEFVSRAIQPGTPPLTDGASVQGMVVGNPLDMITNLQGDLATTINALGRAGDAVANLADDLRGPLGLDTEGPIGRLADRVDLMLEDFSRVMNSADSFFGDVELRQALKDGLSEMPQAVHEVRLTMSDAREAISEVRDAADSVGVNFRNLEGLTEPLGQRGEEITNVIIESVGGIESLLEELAVLTQSLNSREGTLGQIIHNRELYDNLSRLLTNANQVVLRINELSKRMRPVVEDARVFMDKVAREPGRIVGGALNDGPGIK